MKTLVSILSIILLISLTGCSWLSKATKDASEVYEDSKEVLETGQANLNELVESAQDGIDKIIETKDDIKTALDELEEAKDAIDEIRN